MVSGFKLAWRKEIVYRPPEKMCSTATADPVNSSQIYFEAEATVNKTGMVEQD
jgi:hypothetical protein